MCILYIEKGDIQEAESQWKSPRTFKDNLPVLLGTLQTPWQRYILEHCKLRQRKLFQRRSHESRILDISVLIFVIHFAIYLGFISYVFFPIL